MLQAGSMEFPPKTDLPFGNPGVVGSREPRCLIFLGSSFAGMTSSKHGLEPCLELKSCWGNRGLTTRFLTKAGSTLAPGN